MTTPLWCLLIVAALPYLSAGIGVYFRIQQLGSLDANHPRVQALELRDTAARAYGAQANAWEAVGFFTVVVVINHLAGGDGDASATAAIVYVVARVLHALLYVADMAPVRTLAFIVSIGACVRLLQLGISA